MGPHAKGPSNFFGKGSFFTTLLKAFHCVVKIIIQDVKMARESREGGPRPSSRAPSTDALTATRPVRRATKPALEVPSTWARSLDRCKWGAHCQSDCWLGHAVERTTSRAAARRNDCHSSGVQHAGSSARSAAHGVQVRMCPWAPSSAGSEILT